MRMPRTCCQVPRKRLIGVLTFSSDCTAKVPKPDDHLRADQIDLPKQKGLAGRDFVGLGIAILGRPAFDHVADVNVGARHPHPALDYIGEQLARAAHERLAARVLVGAGPLADEHQFGRRIADAEH